MVEAAEVLAVEAVDSEEVEEVEAEVAVVLAAVEVEGMRDRAENPGTVCASLTHVYILLFLAFIGGVVVDVAAEAAVVVAEVAVEEE